MAGVCVAAVWGAVVATADTGTAAAGSDAAGCGEGIDGTEAAVSCVVAEGAGGLLEDEKRRCIQPGFDARVDVEEVWAQRGAAAARHSRKSTLLSAGQRWVRLRTVTSDILPNRCVIRANCFEERLQFVREGSRDLEQFAGLRMRER